MKRGDGRLVRRHQPPQCLEPVLDDGDRGWRRAIGARGVLDHQEALAVGGHIVNRHAADTREEPAVELQPGRARPKRRVRLDVHRHQLGAVQVEQLAPVA